MKKLKLGLAWAAALSMMGGLASCQSEDIVSQGDDNTVAVKAVAHVTMGDDTRTSYTPGENSFKFAWSTGDKIVVVSEDGRRNIGVMALSGEGGQSSGDFEGILNVRPNDTKVNVYYLGRNKTEGLGTMAISTGFNVASQNTDLASVTDYDVMYTKADIAREDDGKVVMNFTVKSIVSIARFCFHLPDGVSASDEAVTVKGKNIYNGYTLNFADASLTDKAEGAISINPAWNGSDGDAFMTFVPAVGAVTEFEVEVDGVVYKAALDEREYGAGKFFCGGQPLHGKDIYFTKDGSWTLNYDANGGTGAPDSMTDLQNFAPSCRMLVSSQIPVREGYRFLGWADDAEATVAQYQPGGTVTITRPAVSKTIYAVWAEEEWHYKEYTLHYDTYGDETQFYSTYCKEPWKFYTDNAPVPTKAGYTFLGWADTQNATEVKYAKTGATIDLTKAVFTKTVYAVWKKNGAEGNVTVPGSKGTNY